MNHKDIQRVLEKVAGKMVEIRPAGFREECPIGIIDINNWEWPQGVGMYGLYRYYTFSGDERWLQYLCGWYDRHLKEGLPEHNVNTTAPMLTLAFLCELTGNERYLQVCTDWAEWIIHELPRTEERGFQHVVSGGANSQQLWDDTLFMAVLFLAKMGVILHKKTYIDETVRQFLLHTKYLCDPESGLWFHGWNFNGRTHFAGAKWARGNSWITADIPDYLEITGLHGGAAQFLIETLSSQIRCLAKLQEPDGMWHTLLDDPGSYVETSATAGFAYGILKSARLGYVDSAYAAAGEKAVEAVVSQVIEDGTVEKVSYGTGMGLDLDFYRTIPCCPMTYGQALSILALCEWLGERAKLRARLL